MELLTKKSMNLSKIRRNSAKKVLYNKNVKHVKLFKPLIIVAPVLALVSPLIVLSNTGCGNPTPEPEIRYLPDGSD
jgi:hypothetical protein